MQISVPRDTLERDVAIQATDLSVCYRARRESPPSIKELVLRGMFRRSQVREIWALREVNLTVRRGELVGVIGANGAGKSTLLKVIARVLRPTRGRVQVRGRVFPILGVGAGFHPELTGRENIHLNATLLGFSARDVRRTLPDIVEFADLGDFINMPLRTYSSGMRARLGFAVVTASRPSLLVIDEVLGVGDEQFKRKCWARFDALLNDGTTLILATHSSGVITKRCNRALWLDRGSVQAFGEPKQVFKAYREAARAKAAGAGA